MINARTVIWVLLIFVMSAWLVGKGKVSTEVTQFMPAVISFEDQLLHRQLQQGSASRLLIIALAGDTKTELAGINKKLSKGLRQNTLFNRIENGEIRVDQKEADWLFERRYLLSPAIKDGHFSVDALRQAFQQRFEELQSPLPLVNRSQLTSDPTAEFQALLKYWKPDHQFKRDQGVWFSLDGQKSLLVAETSAPAYNLKEQEATLQYLKKAFQKASENKLATMMVTGGPIFALESRDTIERESRLFSLLATLAIMSLLLLVYRSPGKVLISALPIITAVMAGVSAVLLFFGSIHGITLVFGITIIGVVIDYPLHLFSHLHRNESAEKSMRRIAPTLLLGAITTAVAYATFIFTDFQGLAQLGVFAIAGLIAGVAVTVLVLPAMLKTTGTKPFFTQNFSGLINRTNKLWPFLLTGMIIFVSLVFYQNRTFPWQDDLAALSPMPDALREMDMELRAQAGANDARYLLTVTDPDRETVLQKTELLLAELNRLKQNNVLRGYDAASLYLPSVKTQEMRQEFLLEKSELQENIQQALKDKAFRENAFLPFLADVEKSRRRAPVTMENYIEGAIQWRLENLLYQVNGKWVSSIPLTGINQIEPLQQVASGAVRLLDLKTATYERVADYRKSALRQLAWGGLAIVLLLAISLRDPRRIIRILMTLALAIAVDIAVLMLLGVRFSLFHLVALLLVTGIGLDYALFFTRPLNNTDEKLRTLHAVLVCAGSTILVFGILALSQIPVLRAIGLTTAVGVAASLVAAFTVTGFLKNKIE